MAGSDGFWETKNIGAGFLLAGFVLCLFWREAGLLSIFGLGLLILGGIQDEQERKRVQAEYKADREIERRMRAARESNSDR